MRRLSTLVLALAVAAGCGSSGDGGDGDDDATDVELSPDVRLLENHPDFESVGVSADHLTYHFSSAAADIDAGEGNVLVGAASGGYLRRATGTSASGNQLDIDTEPASLTDAIVRGELSMPLVDEASDWTPCADGASCLVLDLIDLGIGIGRTNARSSGSSTATILRMGGRRKLVPSPQRRATGLLSTAPRWRADRRGNLADPAGATSPARRAPRPARHKP